MVPPLANGGRAPARRPAPPGVPDGGVAAGHGVDAGERFAQRVRGRVEVPPSDRTPPLALLRLRPGAEPVVHDSPVRPAPRPAVRLQRPELRATALIRDADGGTGRVRVSIVYATRCDGVERQHAAYFPPAQLETIRIAPGVRVPAERVRSGRVAFPPGCAVSGKAFAEATTPTAWRASATRSGSSTGLRPTRQPFSSVGSHGFVVDSVKVSVFA